MKQSVRSSFNKERQQVSRPKSYVEALMRGTRRDKQERYIRNRGHDCKLYEKYLADSGSDSEVECNKDNDDGDDEDNELSVEMLEFTVGMNLNILLEQTAQNLIRSVCLECEAENWCFGDPELLRFVDALKCNSSILSLQIRYLDVSDNSLVPLCHALLTHPSLRALDLSGTKAAMLTSKALRELVCTNSNIIFVRLEDTFVDLRDLAIINEGVRYNAMVCADPSSNPFQLSLLRKLSSLEEKTHTFDEELNAKPWLQCAPTQKTNCTSTVENSSKTQLLNRQKKEEKGKTTLEPSKRAITIDTEICVPYLHGCCSYGSRCSYFHPERSQWPSKVTISHDMENNLLNKTNTDYIQPSNYSVVSTLTSRSRLQSRLRPARFHMKKVNLCEVKLQESLQTEDITVADNITNSNASALPSENVDGHTINDNKASSDDNNNSTSSGNIHNKQLWASAFCTVACCTLIC